MKNEFWLYKKHKDAIEYTDFESTSFRFRINSETQFKLDMAENAYNSLFAWDRIQPSFNFFYDFPENENRIKELLNSSLLVSTKWLYVETLSTIPILKVSTRYFIEHWIDFVNANAGQGSYCLSEDKRLLLEFTDDSKYHLFSNFPIHNDLDVERSQRI
ncbi:MAG: hypothetical protein EOO01_06955 [Chitinophagaceae bacterium]|nr:MAG: hypothetical protein EOO01_06955 [Chitinophagaceae bacterium]